MKINFHLRLQSASPPSVNDVSYVILLQIANEDEVYLIA